ncbi:unnamed protein product, partial [Menidia menidia]
MPDQQDSDMTSQEASIHTPSPRRNGSATNFNFPVHHGSSIRTITQSASRANLNGGNTHGPVRSPAVTILPKRRLEHVVSRPRPLFGSPNVTCRSKSYHRMAPNPPYHYSDNIYSNPLYRKTIGTLHPVEAAGILTAQNYGGHRRRNTRYVIVNEHEPHKKVLRSATRVPRHYLMEEPAEILELYPRSIRRFTSRTTQHQPNSHRSQTSQHCTEENNEEQGKGRKRMSLGKNNRLRSLSDLHQQAHFYIGDHRETYKYNCIAKSRHGAQEGDEAEDDASEIQWGDLDHLSPSQAGGRAAEPLLVRTRHHIHSPGKPSQSPARARHIEPKFRPNMETPLTESDSASLASSSDQHYSSTDQYIQVIHSKDSYLKSDCRQDKLHKKDSKKSFDLNSTESNNLVCSNV